jgi:hypothetical protein
MNQYDVASIRSRLVTRLQSKASWAKILANSVNMRLIDAFSEELSDLANLDTYLTRETKWSLARNASSLLSAEAIHRYEAHRKIGAFGLLRFGISNAIASLNWVNTSAYALDSTIYYSPTPLTVTPVLYKNISAVPVNPSGNTPPVSDPTHWQLLNIAPLVNVDIPKWTVFSDQAGNYSFTSYVAQSLTVGSNWVDINVVQGVPKSYSVTATGINNEEFLLDEANIENAIYELYVNNVLWTKVSNLLDYTSADKVYEIENVLDYSGIYLKFGNDTYGKKLTNGDAVKFYYVSTNGVTGNVNSSNTVNKINSTIYNTNSVVVTAYCTNTEALLGGSEEEDVEQIRLNAPKIFQTGDRASSSPDYVAIIEDNFSFVLKAIVWGAYEYNIDQGKDPWDFIPAEENVVHVAAISVAQVNLTPTEQLQISAGINAYKAPTDIVTYETVRFIGLAFNTLAYVSDTSYTLSSVTNAISLALSTTYSVLALDLFQNIYFSDYQTLIDDVAGVNHHTTYAQLFYNYTFGSVNGLYYVISDASLPTENIRAGSVNIYVQDTVGGQTDWTLVATDDSSNAYTAVSPYDLTGSSINYNDGTGIIQIKGLTEVYTNYTLRVFWREVSDDLLLVNRADIFSFDASSSNITAAYIRN